MLFFKEVGEWFRRAPGSNPRKLRVERTRAKEAAFQAWQRRVYGGCRRVSTSLKLTSTSVLSCCLGLCLCPQQIIFITVEPCLVDALQKWRFDDFAARSQASAGCRQGRAIFLRF